MIFKIIGLVVILVLLLYLVWGFRVICRFEREEREWRVAVLLHLAAIRDNQVSLASYLQD